MEAATTIAAAFLAAVARQGLDPDPELRLLAHAGSPALQDLPDGPFELGPLYESLTTTEARTSRGAWYTPRWLAEQLVARTLPETLPETLPGTRPEDGGPVLDPSCGGGMFLLAAAEHLARSREVGEAMTLLRGIDLDPVAVAVAESALWWWSAERGSPTVLGDQLTVADALDVEWPRATTVIGNPPFLGQLRTDTATDRSRRMRLRERFGDAVRAYTDEAWLFLLAAVEHVEPGGRVTLVQPWSLLAARDAGRVRDRVDRHAELIDLWIDDGASGSAFDAAVDTCAPILHRTDTTTTSSTASASNDWTGRLADRLGVPDIELDSTETCGDRATVTAGFRDEYYGLIGSVAEGGPGPRLVTSGSVDPLRETERPVRFDKRSWSDPRIRADSLDDRATAWVQRQRAPKLVVATQTKVLEAIVDETGDLVAGVPTITVVPDHPDDLWSLAAALHAPVVSAWLVRRTIGTGLGKDTCRPSASTIASIPLPTRPDAWQEATRLARHIAAGDECWDDFARAADAAHGHDRPDVRAWWRSRLPVRSPTA